MPKAKESSFGGGDTYSKCSSCYSESLKFSLKNLHFRNKGQMLNDSKVPLNI